MDINQSIDLDMYMSDRVDNQITWYDGKANKYKRYSMVCQTIEIVLAALIPLLSGYTTYCLIPFIIGIIGAVIAVIGGVSRLYKFQDNWTHYRMTCETLRNQKFLYITGSYPYNTGNEEPYNIFIRNVENIISSENNQWKTINTKTEKNNQSSTNT